MIALIADHKDDIIALCKKHGVVRIELFGSAATGKFNPETSDFDFLIVLGNYDSSVGERFLDFANDMEQLLGRHVDLLTERSIKNPYLKISIDRARELIYAAQDGEAAA